MKCRHCGAELSLPLVDLASAPLSNAYLTEKTLHAPEKWYPLRVLVCEQCWLVQTEDFARADEMFDAEYAYFSGFSKSWLEHCERYVIDVAKRFGLNEESHVVEVAANDGYLLQYVKARNIPCTGVEPTASTAAAARGKGIPIVEQFFGVELAREMVEKGMQADLMVANNVLAHVPDINDFSSGFTMLLKPNGVATFEFPHLLKLVNGIQFDTIYHEHFSYLSLTAIEAVFTNNGLQVFDVEEISTHGGSLRLFSQRADSGNRPITERLTNLREQETEFGMNSMSFYSGFQQKVDEVKNELLAFLLAAKREGKSVVAYGAAAKGNTLLNYAGVRSDLIKFVVDKNPAKQGNYLPGSRIPIKQEQSLKDEKPDYVIILPWNIKHEVMMQLDYIRYWSGKFVTIIPKLTFQ